MTDHVQIYMDFFGYCIDDVIVCEYCNAARAVDVHHIIPRSKFGKKRKDERDAPGNLVGLCRTCHDLAHAEKISKQQLFAAHEVRIRSFKGL